jgi:hypothetical protein
MQSFLLRRVGALIGSPVWLMFCCLVSESCFDLLTNQQAGSVAASPMKLNEQTLQSNVSIMEMPSLLMRFPVSVT